MVKIIGESLPTIPLEPCTARTDADTRRIAIYHGAADTYVGLAFAEVGELLRVVKQSSRL